MIIVADITVVVICFECVCVCFDTSHCSSSVSFEVVFKVIVNFLSVVFYARTIVVGITSLCSAMYSEIQK